MENYLNIDEINSNAIFAPRRIMNDDFKAKPIKMHLKTHKDKTRTQFCYNNFYKQFNLAGTIKRNYHQWGITLKDYKQLFRELNIKAPNGANKEWYVNEYIKSFCN